MQSFKQVQPTRLSSRVALDNQLDRKVLDYASEVELKLFSIAQAMTRRPYQNDNHGVSVY